MKLVCDLCGSALREIGENHAVCDHCGIEYGASRLEELRGEASDPTKKSDVEAKVEPQQKKSGCGIWLLIILAIMDLVIGTHGIVAAFCVIILLIVAACSRKNKGT